MNFLSQEGNEIVEMKTVILSNKLMKNAVLAGISSLNLPKSIEEALSNDEVSLDNLKVLLVNNKRFIDKKKKDAEFKRVAKMWEDALSRANVKFFQIKEIDGKITIVHKIGYNDIHFMRYFRLTKEEFEKEQASDPSFFEKYAKLRLLALFKKFKDSTSPRSKISTSMSDFYYDKELKTYNRDIMITVNLSMDEFYNKKTISYRDSVIEEIAEFFKDLKDLKEKM